MNVKNFCHPKEAQYLSDIITQLSDSLASTGKRKDFFTDKSFFKSATVKLGCLDRTSKTSPLPGQLIKGPDGLQGGKKPSKPPQTSWLPL